jgi:hypothetical protein
MKMTWERGIAPSHSWPWHYEGEWSASCPGFTRRERRTPQYPLDGRIGGVVVSVLATGPKVCRFELSQGNGFLRATKICSTPSFGWEVKLEVPCHEILQHVKISWSPTWTERLNFHFLRPPPTCSRDVSDGWQETREYWWLPEISLLAGNQPILGLQQRCLCWQDCQTVLRAVRSLW